MGADDISKDLRQFIFDHIDSVEQLEVLVFLSRQRESSYSAQAISNELRSNKSSIERRLHKLKGLHVVVENAGELFQYNSSGPLDELISKLAEEYRVRKQTILSLVFSPLKRSRDFADAFVIYPKKKDEDDNG